MKPIHHLHRVGRSAVNAIGVKRTPIATDDADGRMLREPGGHALRRALGQQVKHPMILQIDQDGPVALPAPPGPLIDPKHLRGGAIKCRGCLHEPQQGGWTGPQPQPSSETRTGLSAKSHAKGEQELGKPSRATRPRGRHGEQALRENLARARRIVTEKLAHPQLQAYGVGAPRQIGEGSCVLAVDPRGLYVAERAGDTGLGRGHVERDLGGGIIDVPRWQGQPRPIR